eukprot:612089-Pyramimonas_sp.AAC.1
MESRGQGYGWRRSAPATGGGAWQARPEPCMLCVHADGSRVDAARPAALGVRLWGHLRRRRRKQLARR